MALGAALTPIGGKIEETLEALRKEIKRVQSKKVRSRELEKAQNQMLRGLVTENLYVANKARALGSAAVLEGDIAGVNQRLETIQQVTAGDLQRVAKQYLDPKRELAFRVERNLKSLRDTDSKNPEDEAPITGEPETTPPAPGRPGAIRPDDYPATPPMAAPLDFDPTPQYQSATLDNGLKVVVIENHEVPFISMSLHLRAGAWSETKPGCASMAMSMLTKGTKKYDESELADELETYAINLSGNAVWMMP